MAGGMSVGGLASGLDTSSIINQLVALERLTVTRLEKKQESFNLTLSSWGTLKSDLTTLKTKGETLSEADLFDKFQVASSNEDILTVEGRDNGNPGTFAIQVFQTAKSEKIMSKTYASQLAALGISGEFKVNVTAEYKKTNSAATDVAITIGATDSLKDVANKINGAANIGISASIIKFSATEYSMVLTSKDTGSQGASYTESVNTVLQDLGVLNALGNKGNAAQVMQTAVTNTSGGPAITAATLISAIDGSAVTQNDTITIQGTDRNGNTLRARQFILGDAATQTVGDLLKEIESAFNGMVTASVDAAGRILVTDKNEGKSALSINITANNEGGGSLDFGGTMNVNTAGKNGILQTGLDAFFNVDGLYLKSATNTADDAIEGVTVKMKKADLTESVTATIDRDYDAMVKNVQEFVDSFNPVTKYIDEQSKVKVTQAKSDDPSTQKKTDKIESGPLAGDSTVGRLKSELRNILTRQHEELKGARYTSVASVGVTIDQYTGEYKVDADKFKKAMLSDYENVKKLFVMTGETEDANFQYGASTVDTKSGRYRVDSDANTISRLDRDDNVVATYAAVREANILRVKEDGAAKGLAVTVPATGNTVLTFSKGLGLELGDYIKKITDTYDGYISQRTKTIETQIKDYDTKIADEEDRVTRYENKLKVEYSAMEQTMSRLQSQSAQMQSALR
ncbi:MAG: flagellar filament capping protein FliD [Fibrobacterota bacterium]